MLNTRGDDWFVFSWSISEGSYQNQMKHTKPTPADVYKKRAGQADFRQLEDVSGNFVIFVLLLEDCAFFKHKRGWSPYLTWTAFCDFLRGKHGYGGSTITTQLVKNLYFTFERRGKRKLLELLYASRFEKHLTKRQILELYINTVYYDNGQYGVCSASRFYFQKEPSELTVNQAFFLASLLPVVGIYNPLYHQEEFVMHRNRKLENVPYAETVLPKPLVEEIVRHGPDCLDEELCVASPDTDRYNAPGPMVNERFGPGGREPLAEEAAPDGISKQQRLVLERLSDTLFHGSSNAVACEEDLIPELLAQAVLPLANLQDDPVWQRLSASVIADNMRILYEHSELHELLSSNGIPYVILKGVASASYYPEPILRTMGDIDFLIRPSDIPKATELLTSADFAFQEESEGVHVLFRRDDSVWEMHYSVRGIPENEAGALIRSYLSDIIETAAEYDIGDCSIWIPDDFHHGLVLLLHTAFHFTSDTGVGLRHLCDWAVFFSHFTEAQFVGLFEERLRKCGLWRFAQILTLISASCFRLPRPSWAGEMEEATVRQLVGDILNGGNFGHKDPERYHHIKYIVNLGKNTLDGKPPILQIFSNIRNKAEAEHKTGLSVVKDYISGLLSGDKWLDNRKIIKRAAARKKLFREFHLFEP